MKIKLTTLGFMLILSALSVLIFSACGSTTAQPNESPTPVQGEHCVDKDTGAKLSYQEAVDIAQRSECIEQGQLKETHLCNENTGTWWIDLDVDKPGCSPACVVDVPEKTAEINWRCTGLLPPSPTAGEATQYEATVHFNTSVTQDDIDEASALLRAYDQDLEFLIMESWPPIGRALLATDAPDFCEAVQAELEARSYVDDVSCGPCTGSQCGSQGPAPDEPATSTAITGTVMDVSLSARIITLAEGPEVVALTEQTKLVSPSGGEATLQDVRPGMRIQASGQAGESGALLAEVVLILSDEAPAPVVPADEPSDPDAVDYLYDVTVRFNTSVTQDDIDEASALLRAYDEDLDFVIMESWPPVGRALLKDGLNLCPALLEELEGKSYVDDVSCEPMLGG